MRLTIINHNPITFICQKSYCLLHIYSSELIVTRLILNTAEMETEKILDDNSEAPPFENKEKFAEERENKSAEEIAESIAEIIKNKVIKTEEGTMGSGQGQPADSSTNSETFSLAETLLPNEAIKLEPIDSLEDDTSLLQVDQLSNTAAHDHINTHIRIRKYGPRVRNNISPDTSVCEVCQAEFSNRQLLDSHKLCHFNTAHVCYVCDSYFFNADTLVLHVATIHKSLIPAGHDKDGFFCYICLLRFVSSKSLAHHQQSHITQDTKSFSCRVCGVDFTTSRNLMAHLNSSRHAEMKVKITSIFLCIDCRSIFGTRDAYAMHMMMRAQSETCKCTNEEQLPRAVCSPQLTNQNSSSQLSGNGSASTSPLNLSAMFPCRICGTQFASESLLSLHLLMHSRSQSTASDTQNSDSITENRTPNGRPNSAPITDKENRQGFVCVLCKNFFDSQDDLAMHLMTSHNDQTKLANQQQNLPLLQRASENSMYASSDLHLVCHLCQQKFISKDSLAMHMMQHAHNQDHLKATNTSRSAISIMQSENIQSAAKRMRLSPSRESEDSMSLGGKVTPSTDGSEHLSGPPTMVPPKCFECNMVFLDTYALSVHMRSPHHQQKSTSTTPSAGFTCVLCKAVFYTQTSYLVHLQISHAQPAASILTSDTNNSALSILTTQAAQSTCKSSTSSSSEPLNLAVDHDTSNVIADQRHTSAQGEMNYNQEDDCFTNDAHAKNSFLNNQASNELLHNSSSTPLDGPTQIDGVDIVDFVKSNSSRLMACKYCKIIYTDRTVYHLHMGLHNVNNMWQCNMCGKVCQDVYEFSSHVIHMGY